MWLMPVFDGTDALIASPARQHRPVPGRDNRYDGGHRRPRRAAWLNGDVSELPDLPPSRQYDFTIRLSQPLAATS